MSTPRRQYRNRWLINFLIWAWDIPRGMYLEFVWSFRGICWKCMHCQSQHIADYSEGIARCAGGKCSCEYEVKRNEQA